MKIYHLSWYDEDSYGPMHVFYVIVKSNNEKEAMIVAENYIKEMYNTTVEKIQRDREKFEIRDITNCPVLTSGYSEL